jgi:hypothetical protein
VALIWINERYYYAGSQLGGRRGHALTVLSSLMPSSTGTLKGASGVVGKGMNSATVGTIEGKH